MGHKNANVKSMASEQFQDEDAILSLAQHTKRTINSFDSEIVDDSAMQRAFGSGNKKSAKRIRTSDECAFVRQSST